MTRQRLTAAFLALAMSGAPAAHAHMPYVLPIVFDVGKGDHITVESGFAEELFVPEVAMHGASFHLVGPDGSQHKIATVTHLRDLSIFEADIPIEGTWRVTTGQRAGRKGKMFRRDGEWVMRGEGGEPPAGTELVDVQSMTLAEAYVTRGQATETALRPGGHALEIRAVTHPNSIASGSDARFVLLFEGKALAGAEVTVFRSAGRYDGRKVAAQIRTGSDGSFSVKPEDAGTYLILARHRAAAPAGAETPYRSYTYTLVFDAA